MAVPADVTFDLQKATTYFNHTTVGYINAYWKQPPANSEWANGIAWLDNATEDIADVGTTANAIANIQQEILSAIVALKKTTVGMKNKKWKVPPSNSQWYVAITHINQAKVLTQKIGGFQEYDDANQVNAVAHISADEEFNGAYIDATTIAGKAFLSASEFYTPSGGSNNYSDPGTIAGLAVISGVDKMLPFKDTGTVIAHAVISGIETGFAGTPTPPTAYTLPGSYTLVTNGATLISALALSKRNIVCANGTYDNASPFLNPNSSSVYAQNLLGAEFTAGLTCGGNFGSGGAIVQGLAFNISDRDKSTDSGESMCVQTWGNSGENTSILDCTFEGNNVVDYALFGFNPDGMILQRVQGQDFLSDGFRLSDNNNASTAIINIVSDVNIANVVASPPGSTSGTAEVGLWIGHPVTNGVSRILANNCYTAGIETVNHCFNTTFSDLSINSPFVCIYIEHFTEHCVFQNFHLTTGVGQPAGTGIGIISEWDDGTPGNAAGHFNTINSGTITNGRGGVYLDAGTESTIVENVVFINQYWAAIGAYLNIGTNTYTGNDYSALHAGAVPTSTSHI